VKKYIKQYELGYTLGKGSYAKVRGGEAKALLGKPGGRAGGGGLGREEAGCLVRKGREGEGGEEVTRQRDPT
jgi:hypothetical protein